MNRNDNELNSSSEDDDDDYDREVKYNKSEEALRVRDKKPPKSILRTRKIRELVTRIRQQEKEFASHQEYLNYSAGEGHSSHAKTE